MIPEYIKRTLEALENMGYESYIVGGAVRDMIRGVPVHDYDITTNALPEQTCAAMTEAGFKKVTDMSEKYGTVVFADPAVPGSKIEITTFRSDDDYEDQRHPQNVSFGASLEQDASRRDFTVNSIYMDKDGNIKDPNNGRDDIMKGVIRAIGIPGERFREDALRILRAVRFEAKTGFKITNVTSEAMIEHALLLKNISAERICAELTGIVTAINGPAAIRDNLEVVSVIIPELLLQKDFDQKSKFHDRDLLTHTLDTLNGIPTDDNGIKDTALAYAALLHDIGKPAVFTIDEDGVGHMKTHADVGKVIAERVANELKLPNDLKYEIKDLVTYHDSFPEPERKSVRRFVSRHGAKFCEKLFILQRSDVRAHSVFGKERYERLMKINELYLELMEEGACLTVSDLAISGQDIMDLGVPEGPGVGVILHDLLSKVLDEVLENAPKPLISYVREHYLKE
ncbi:MAG: HD domain-containing protein [Saccharofermentans sp.]|nr:HD domain-containing protein [Saccharofermentans sp.]